MITPLILSCSQALKAWLRPHVFLLSHQELLRTTRYDRLRDPAPSAASVTWRLIFSTGHLHCFINIYSALFFVETAVSGSMKV